MTAFQTQLTAMRHDVLAAQNVVFAKKGNDVNFVCQVHLLPSSSTGTSVSNLLPDRPLVLRLPATPLSSDNIDDAHEEIGSELKKWKCMLALQNGEPFAAEGELGNFVIGSNVSQGGDVEMNVIDNHLFAEHDVRPGPDDQACLGK